MTDTAPAEIRLENIRDQRVTPGIFWRILRADPLMTESDLINHRACVTGIDPGLSGAICRIGRGYFDVRCDFKSGLDIAVSIQELVAPPVSHVIMELVHAMPGQGVCSMFSFGRATGVIDGALALCFPGDIELANPQKWQNFYRRGLNIPKIEEFNSRAVAKLLFPSHQALFSRVLDHNSADACLMAVYLLLNLPET